MKRIFYTTLTAYTGFTCFRAAHLLLLALFALGLQLQALRGGEPRWDETGVPYIQNVSPEVYGENPQNWCVVQDDRGLMFFGNGHGILVFDGYYWKTISTPRKTTVRSMCLLDGRVYVGAQNEIGYLQGDRKGRLRYISLLDRMPVAQRDFTDVWQAHAINGQVFFRTSSFLFRWSGDRFASWEPDDRFHTAFDVNNRLYVRQWGHGLMMMEGDSLQLLPGGELFAGERVYAVLPYDSSQILIGTRGQGLFLFDGREMRRFNCQADPFLSRKHLYHGARLPGGLFALGTRLGGVAIIDMEGNICQIIDKQAGLRDDNVRYVYPDRQGGLWLALNNGLARVETPSPYSRFAESRGIVSSVESIVRHKGKVYAATHRGVYHLTGSRPRPASFNPVQGVDAQSWYLLNRGEELLAGTAAGIFRIRGDRGTLLDLGVDGVRTLQTSHRNPDIVYAGLQQGLAVLHFQRGRWTLARHFPQVAKSIIKLVEDEEGYLWMGTVYDGVLRAPLEQLLAERSGGDAVLALDEFGKSHGLPDQRISPAQVQGKVLFATQRGLRRFEEESSQFVADSTFGEVFADTACWIYHISEDAQKRCWFIARNRNTGPLSGPAVLRGDGTYEWRGRPFLRINDLGALFTIYPEPGGRVWLGGSDGIARYSPSSPAKLERQDSALIRRVSGIESDSVYYYGAAPAGINPLELRYGQNSLRIEFAAPFYDDVPANRYRFILDGYDEKWSAWTPEARKDYTGLPAADYVFRVRSRNVFGVESGEGTFSFTVLPPWYQTWWAYFLYAALATGLVLAIVKSRVRHLERLTRELEAIVADRTEEIVSQKTRIEEQAERLQELDRMKSRFFANISHEFRTPLTLILGPLDDAIARSDDGKTRKELGMMRRNARRLLKLINQLLELSRLESDKLSLNLKPQLFLPFFRGVVMSFASYAAQRGVSLDYRAEDPQGDERRVCFDADRVEKIFTNLISNALKFTPEGGRVDVTVEQLPEDEQDPTLQVRISDTGVGIAPDHLPHIFDRFYQIDGSATRHHPGTGIGLALTRELVDLHGGDIAVESVPGRGTTFTVRLHMEPEPVSADQTAAAPGGPEMSVRRSGDAAELDSAAQPSLRTQDAQELPEDATIVLVVEDHADVRAYIRSHLEDEYRIIEATNGREGIEKATTHLPDLVISDVMMPEMDGFQLCHRLKTDEKSSHIPVILLTARAGEQSRIEGLETGADDYLTKPFSSRELQVRVRNLIQLRKELRERFSGEVMVKPADIAVTSMDAAFLERLMSHIEASMSDERFGVEILSEQIGMSRRQLHRKLRALTNQTPTEYLRSFRLERARQLLRQGAGNVTEIAYSVGFNNLSYFARCFKDQFGKLPSEVVPGNPR